MNNIQSTPAFTSTIIPNQAMKNMGKFVDQLNSCFEVKGIVGSAQKVRNSINLGQAGVTPSKEGFIVVGKDKSADNFIFRRLKEIDKNVKYIDDAPEMKSDASTIDFSILA